MSRGAVVISEADKGYEYLLHLCDQTRRIDENSLCKNGNQRGTIRALPWDSCILQPEGGRRCCQLWQDN